MTFLVHCLRGVHVIGIGGTRSGTEARFDKKFLESYVNPADIKERAAKLQRAGGLSDAENQAIRLFRDLYDRGHSDDTA